MFYGFQGLISFPLPLTLAECIVGRAEGTFLIINRQPENLLKVGLKQSPVVDFKFQSLRPNSLMSQSRLNWVKTAPPPRFVPISSHLVSFIKWFECERQIKSSRNYIRQAARETETHFEVGMAELPESHVAWKLRCGMKSWWKDKLSLINVDYTFRSVPGGGGRGSSNKKHLMPWQSRVVEIYQRIHRHPGWMKPPHHDTSPERKRKNHFLVSLPSARSTELMTRVLCAGRRENDFSFFRGRECVSKGKWLQEFHQILGEKQSCRRKNKRKLKFVKTFNICTRRVAFPLRHYSRFMPLFFLPSVPLCFPNDNHFLCSFPEQFSLQKGWKKRVS